MDFLISTIKEVDFLISRNKFHFMISKIVFLDIKKIFLDIKISRITLIPGNDFLIQEFYFLISRNQILDIKKYLINSKTAPQNIFLGINKSNS